MTVGSALGSYLWNKYISSKVTTWDSDKDWEDFFMNVGDEKDLRYTLGETKLETLTTLDK